MTAAIATRAIPHRDRSRDRALVRAWLFTIAFLIVVMVIVGGATRLTDSGLSITEWKPIHGIVPPLSDADWQEEFAKYRQIPEYQVINRGMEHRRIQGDLLVGMGASAARTSDRCRFPAPPPFLLGDGPH